MWNRIEGARAGAGLAALRLTLGSVFVVHGAMKVFGGMAGTAGFFASIGIPAPGLTAWAVGLIELLGGVLLLLGLFTLPAAGLLAAVMLGAIATVHWANGFMASNGGWEFNFVLLGGLVAMMLEGPGAWSLRAAARSGTAPTAAPAGEAARPRAA
jgi:putative oxidoreductase